MGGRKAPIPFSENPVGWCRWCGKKIIDPKTGGVSKRRRWHPECVEAYRLTWPAVWRERVWKHRGGVCGICGRQCGKWIKWYEGPVLSPSLLKKFASPKDPQPCRYSAVRFVEHYRWEADHIRPLADGGDHSLENGQVACYDCHRVKTSRENSIRARRRRKT